jgi:hypothetical protein
VPHTVQDHVELDGVEEEGERQNDESIFLAFTRHWIVFLMYSARVNGQAYANLLREVVLLGVRTHCPQRVPCLAGPPIVAGAARAPFAARPHFVAPPLVDSCNRRLFFC